MKVRVLGISTSPRLKGNSDLLLREALAGAQSVSAKTEYIRVCDLKIQPCIECNRCYETGRCRIEDDFHLLLKKILGADRLIFATPIFFMTVCAQAKILIDRCQCLWAKRYVLKEPLITDSRQARQAIVIAVGGSNSTKQFKCIELTMRSFFDVLDMQYRANLFINKIDEIGAIKKHPAAIEQAYHLGQELVRIPVSTQKKLINVELF
jgi:multimeric flavodoxin WrbA